jgi:hypothetical protein
LNLTETKVCSICVKEKQLIEYYTIKNKRKNGDITISYYPYCKECAKEKASKRQKENYPKIKEKRHENPYPSRLVAKNYRKNHPEAFYAYTKQWQEEHPEKVKEYNTRYKDKKFKISRKQWDACKKYFNNSCAYCGISAKDAKEKYNKTLNKEHAFNNGANDITNCIPSCTGCNSLKSKQDYIDWYTPENPIYSEERFNAIEQWLNVDHKEYI